MNLKVNKIRGIKALVYLFIMSITLFATNSKVEAMQSQDTFTRIWKDGWGATDTGDIYKFYRVGMMSIDGSTGKMFVPSTTDSPRTYLPNISLEDVDATLEFSSDTPTTTGNQYTNVYARYSPTANGTGYGCYVRFTTASQVQLIVVVRSNGAETVLSTTTIPALTFTPGTFYHIRYQVSGNTPTTIKAKLWQDGSTEPIAWAVTNTDSTAAFQGITGFVAIKNMLGGAGSNTTFTYDNLFITDTITSGLLTIPSVTAVPTDTPASLPSQPTVFTFPPDTTLLYTSAPSGNTMPAYLTPTPDALYGTTILRIADQAAFNSSKQYLRNYYAKNQPWNADGSLVMLMSNPRTIQILDGHTYQYLRTITMAIGVWSNNSDPIGVWSNTDPMTIYSVTDNQLKKINPETGAESILHTFSDYNSLTIGDGEGNVTNDDRFVAFQAKKTTGNALIVYDIEHDSIVSEVAIGSTWPDWISLSQTGNYVVVNWGIAGSTEGRGIDVYDRNLHFLRHINDYSEHGDLGFDAEGHEVFVMVDPNNSGNIIANRLDGAGILGIQDTYYTSTHISCRALQRPGWCYASDGQNLRTSKGANDIFAVKIDGSQTIEQFAVEHQTPGTSYWTNAHAVPNRTGTIVMWGSLWEASEANPVYAFIALYQPTTLTPTVTASATTTVTPSPPLSPTSTASTGGNRGSGGGGSTGEATLPDNTKSKKDLYALGYKAEWIAQYTASSYEGTANDGDDYFDIPSCTVIDFWAELKNTGTKAWFSSTYGKANSSNEFTFATYKDPKVKSAPSWLGYDTCPGESCGKSYFKHDSWVSNYRIGTLLQKIVLPGENGTVKMKFQVPCNAEKGRYREDISAASGSYWVSNTINGDPLNIMHIWVGFDIK